MEMGSARLQHALERRDISGSLAVCEPPADRFRHIQFFSGASSLACPPAGRGSLRTETRLDRKTPVPSAETVSPEIAEFLAWILRRAGVDPKCYRDPPLLRRMPACLRRLKCRTVADARARLEARPELLAAAVGALLIGVTSFFRDPAVFDVLDRTVLPKLAAVRPNLRVWSAGCSDGAELYSVAMLMARQGLLEGSLLLGTDCREEAIGKASEGCYNDLQLQSVAEDWRTHYFESQQGGARVVAPLRRAACWQRQSVLDPPPPGEEPWDMILCRNLAIYLQPCAAAEVWSRLCRSLRPGGVLIVGKAERPAERSLMRVAPCVFRKMVTR